MAGHLTATATGCSGILAVTVSDSHVAATSTAMVTCINSTLGVGSPITVHLGNGSTTDRVFSGYVKMVERKQAEAVYVITAANVMIRAVDYFIASSDPKKPYTAKRIKAEKLVKDIMGMAGLSVIASNTNFTFGINTEVKVNLTSSYDFCKFIANILAWHIWADNDGKVYFKDRKPYPTGGGSIATLDDSNIISINNAYSDRDLRNRVVVYGMNGVHAEAKAASPYLPSGFYKTVVVAAPTLIDSKTMAQRTANYNLAKLNRLTRSAQVTIIGNPKIECRKNVTVNKGDIGMTGQWYIYGMEHSWSNSGYTTSLELRY